MYFLLYSQIRMGPMYAMFQEEKLQTMNAGIIALKNTNTQYSMSFLTIYSKPGNLIIQVTIRLKMDHPFTGN